MIDTAAKAGAAATLAIPGASPPRQGAWGCIAGARPARRPSIPSAPRGRARAPSRCLTLTPPSRVQVSFWSPPPRADRPPATARSPEPTSLGAAAAAAAAGTADAAIAAAAAAADSTVRHHRRHRHTRHHRCRGDEVRCAALMPHPAPCTPTPPAVLGWRRGWRGWWLPQALAALLAVLSGCFARRRSQLPSSRASQDLKKGCSDKSRFFLACTGPCRPDLKLRPIP